MKKRSPQRTTRTKAPDESTRSAFFADVFENAQDAIMILRGNLFVDCNRKTLDLFGCTREELINQSPEKFSPPLQPDCKNSHDKAREMIERAASSGSHIFEWRHMKTSGEVFDAEVYLRPFKIGRKRFLQATVRDITERIAVQDALKSSMEKYRFLIENINDIIMIVDARGKIAYSSPVAGRLTGYSEDELAGRPVLDFIHPGDLDLARKRMTEVISGAIESAQSAYRIRTASGEYRWFQTSSRTSVGLDGGRTATVVLSDITEKKRADEEAVLNRDKFEKAFYSTPAISAISDIDTGRYIEVNDSFVRFYDLPREQTIGKTSLELGLWMNPGRREEIVRALRERGGPVTLEVDVKMRDGSLRNLLFSVDTVTYNDGKTYLLTSAVDITDINRAQRELLESQERLSTLINAMPDIVCFKDGQGRWLEANKFDLELFQLEGVDYKGKKDSDLAPFSPFYREAFLTCEETDEAAWKAGGPSRGDEVIPRPDGPPMTFDIIKVPTFDPSGARKGLVVVGRDVTERKRIEKLLRLQRDLAIKLSSEEDLSTALDRVLETTLMVENFECGGIYLMDPKSGGLNLTASRGLSEGFMKLESFFPAHAPNTQLVMKGEPVYQSYAQLIERLTGGPLNGVRREEGLTALAVIPFKHGESVIGCLNLASRTIDSIPQFSRDALESIGVQVGSVTGRLRAEQIIRESLAEKEMLLKEIHHRVKNNMQIISSLLQLQIYRLHDARDQELITNLQNSVRSMALVHERLYRSESMARIHMAPYIRDLTGEMLQFNPIAQRVGFSMQVDDVLLAIDEAVPCGLILNELVTNALKHGFSEGRTGTILVRFRMDEGMRVLTVRDDGAGIPESVNLDTPSSLGMRLVNALVKQLSGTMQVKRSAGTSIEIRF